MMDSNEAFKARMMEQVCQIEKYKKNLEKQGRILSIDEAAMEWINHYAADFPQMETVNAFRV